MRFLLSLLFVSAVCCPAVYSQEERPRHRSPWWKASLAALAASTAVDAASSWGRLEANPFLRNGDGRFGVQGIAIKAAMVGGVAAAQHLLLRNHPKHEIYAAGANFALSGVFVGVAVSNYQRARLAVPPQPAIVWPGAK